ncbi:TROVE domain-containing protein [Streptomyces sp. NPDC020965]|uniref:TROVE domain-containing protein n=1 Tax=Streptomyces sp. NPDC020965 TaxID=3365105 RepID=UPI0037A049CA
MSRFNIRGVRPAVGSPVTTTGETELTHQGATGYLRDTRGELFLLAVANLVGQDTVYERAGDRDDRFTRLVRQLAVEDPAWTAGLLAWLRGAGNLRTAALVGAAEFVRARLDADQDGTGLGAPTGVEPQDAGWNRRMIASVLQRADEPGELLGYWTQRYGRRLPKPLKRGIADAVQRLYMERSLLKYDTSAHGYRFGDVLELVHAAPSGDRRWQGDLFKHAIDRRHHRDEPIPARLTTLHARAELTALPVEERRTVLTSAGGVERLRSAGMTWEAVAGWLQGPLDAAAWEAVIPSMGYMALLRNLRNFDQAGVSDRVAAQVAARLTDPAQVELSRQLPMRFYSAHRAAPTLRWGHALDQALNASLGNIPSLPGRTLILVDTSSSMEAGFSRDGTLMRWDAAALFGIALGRRAADADVVSFSSGGWRGRPGTKVFPLQRAESLLRSVDRWQTGGWFLGGGTDTAGALRAHFDGHDRVVIVTDEQAAYDSVGVGGSIPATVPLYTWNLAGYRAGHAPSGEANRHAFGGLTDAAFRLIPLLERGRDAHWPWEQPAEPTPAAR